MESLCHLKSQAKLSVIHLRGKHLIITSLLNSNAIVQFARIGFVWVALVGAATMQWDNFT